MIQCGRFHTRRSGYTQRQERSWPAFGGRLRQRAGSLWGEDRGTQQERGGQAFGVTVDTNALRLGNPYPKHRYPGGLMDVLADWL